MGTELTKRYATNNMQTIKINGLKLDAPSGKSALKPAIAYQTKMGSMFRGLSEQVLCSELVANFRGKVDLIFTSPPFPLNRKKKYDNLQGDAYVKWLSDFAPIFKDFLKPTGSIVM